MRVYIGLTRSNGYQYDTPTTGARRPSLGASVSIHRDTIPIHQHWLPHWRTAPVTSQVAAPPCHKYLPHVSLLNDMQAHLKHTRAGLDMRVFVRHNMPLWQLAGAGLRLGGLSGGVGRHATLTALGDHQG